MSELGSVTTTKHTLPSNADDWVVLKNELLLGDLIAIETTETATQEMVVGLSRFITSWSFTTDGAPVEISPDTVQKLKTVDVNYLADEFKKAMEASQAGLTNDEKKDSSSSLPEGETTTANPLPITVTTD